MKNIVITIGREYGSGGREIGEKLAKALGFEFYDKDLIKDIADKTGMTEQTLQKADEKTANPLFSTYYPPALDPGSLNDRLFKMQADFMLEKAETENCVIVGRCGNYILQDLDNVINVFVYAGEEFKTQVVMDRHNLPHDEAAKMMKKIDKHRQAYYQFYTEMKWGRKDGFDILINSELLGFDGTVELLKEIVAKKQAELNK